MYKEVNFSHILKFVFHISLHSHHLFLLSDNSRVVSQYTDQVEEQHAYIKETVDTVFPSNIRILTVSKDDTAHTKDSKRYAI